MRKVKFGLLPFWFECKTEVFTISALLTGQEISTLAEDLAVEASYDDGWCYPPVAANSNENPVKPSPWFGLACTNEIAFKDDSVTELVANMTITFVGLIFGLHLRPEKWGFYRRTPLQQGKLSHFVLVNRDLPGIIDHFIRTTMALDLRKQKLMFAALNGHLGTPSFVNQHEEFDSCYKTFDTIYSLVVGRTGTHDQRIDIICKRFDIDTPEWAIAEVGKGSRVSSLRNSLIHELHFNGEPVGLSLLEDNTNLYFHRLNEVLLFCAVGFSLDKREIVISSRGRYGLTLKWQDK